eukprot:15653376-Heterocapsa_arctica.AAC.1
MNGNPYFAFAGAFGFEKTAQKYCCRPRDGLHLAPRPGALLPCLGLQDFAGRQSAFKQGDGGQHGIFAGV